MPTQQTPHLQAREMLLAPSAGGQPWTVGRLHDTSSSLEMLSATLISLSAAASSSGEHTRECVGQGAACELTSCEERSLPSSPHCR